MLISSSPLRMAVRRARKNTEEDFRRKIHDTHKYVFMFISFSMAILFNVTLLLEKIFNCENIANKCYICVLISGWTVVTISLLWLKMNFGMLIICFWSLVPTLISLLLVTGFGSGNRARILFILIHGINGALEAVLLQASTFVISELFLNSAISILYSGYSLGSISMGLFQLAMERVVGTSTVAQMRLCAVLCYTVQITIAFSTAIWITYLYYQYGWMVSSKRSEPESSRGTIGSSGDSQGGQDVRATNGSGGAPEAKTDDQEEGKMRLLSKVIPVMPYCIPRLIVQGSGTLLRAFFHPYLVPFMVDIPSEAKTVIALSYTLFDFLGTNYANKIDETIDPLEWNSHASSRSHGSSSRTSTSHSSFIFTRNLSLYILGMTSLSAVVFTVWNIWSCRFAFPKSPFILLLMTAVNGFVGGILTGRGMNGCLPILEYYNKQKDGEGRPIVGDDIVKLGNIVNDISFIFDYAVATTSSICSNIVEGIILRHKSSRAYILRNGKGNLSAEAVNALLMQFKK